MCRALQIAIDFTGSNGDPRLPTSLHHLDPAGRVRNQYQAAIEAVGGVLECYDTDKIFPVFGFGGCPVPRKRLLLSTVCCAPLHCIVALRPVVTCEQARQWTIVSA